MDAGDFYIRPIWNQCPCARLIVFRNSITQESETAGMGGELIVGFTHSRAAGHKGCSEW